MSSIVKSIGDLIGSVFEVIWSFITTAGQLVEKTFEFVLRIVQEFGTLILNFFKGLVDLAGGLASFVLGNVVIIGVLAVGFFGFLQYQRSQGRTVKVGDKKLN